MAVFLYDGRLFQACKEVLSQRGGISVGEYSARNGAACLPSRHPDTSLQGETRRPVIGSGYQAFYQGQCIIGLVSICYREPLSVCYRQFVSLSCMAVIHLLS